MSIDITIAHAVKKYGPSTIIPDLSLQIGRGEFFTLLGPSGCGKTTLLRMIAGFNTIEGGDFYFNDRRINDLEPGKRGIGMVFQNYAIFPNMTVRKNVEFGLRYRKVAKERRAAEAERFLRLVHVDQYADRMPEKLSGGQQQRVALARALVIQPDVLLMDEPLSNLDAKLRVEMRAVIRALQRDVGITTLYVTHDQEEAMAISDRIAVMKEGEILHCGAPKNIYQRPASLFVATFIGKTNLLKARLDVQNGAPALRIAGEYVLPIETMRAEEAYEREVIVSARPEELLLRPATAAKAGGLAATVRDSVFLGLNTHYFAQLRSGEAVEIVQESQIDSIIPAGSAISLAVNAAKINLFDPQSGLSLMKGVQNSIGLPGERREGAAG